MVVGSGGGIVVVDGPVFVLDEDVEVEVELVE